MKNTSQSNFYQTAFSLIELMISIAIVATLFTIAIPAYNNHQDKENVTKSIVDITEISAAIDRYYASQLRFPESLTDIAMNNKKDPWGNAYQYLNITTVGNLDKPRKDRNLHPVNSDYDLYSMGKDGLSKANFSNSKSVDDVVRANNGRFLGLAADY